MSELKRQFVLRTREAAQSLWAFLKANWEAMAARDRPLLVTIQEYKSKRSLEQNRRYFAMLEQIAEQAWYNGRKYSNDDWHEAFKRMFIGSVDIPNGTRAMSSTLLNVEQFNEYMEKVEAFAAVDLSVELNLK